jgi:glyoxylase-like metal-dependent hydrolase (beta-lactamase superfamily II)
MMELLPNLHWIEGRTSNIYFWTGLDSLILIDTGMPGDLNLILSYIHERACQITDLSAILITHADIDHAGSLAAIQKRSGAKVYAGAETARLLAEGKAPKHMPKFVQFLSDRLFRFRSVPEDAIYMLSDGDRIPELEDWHILATPGHSPDHHSFYSPVHGILFAGDALDMRTGQLQLAPERFMADEELARNSARHLLRLAPAAIACGHGRPLLNHSANDMMSLYHKLNSELDNNSQTIT